jgi:hypothetical protein
LNLCQFYRTAVHKHPLSWITTSTEVQEIHGNLVPLIAIDCNRSGPAVLNRSYHSSLEAGSQSLIIRATTFEVPGPRLESKES